MKLFNLYKNIDFIFLTDYINNAINNKEYKNVDEFKKNLDDEKQNTFPGVKESLLNLYKDGDENINANLFCIKDKKVIPLMGNTISIIPSIAEKIWLYHAVNDPKAELFFDKSIIEVIKKVLKKDEKFFDMDKYIDILKFNEEEKYSVDFKFVFKTILKSIIDKTYIIVDNCAFDGNFYKNNIVIPYKIGYDAAYGTYSLSCYLKDEKKAIKINLANIKKIQQGEKVKDYEKEIEKLKKDLDSKIVDTPLEIIVCNKKNGYDRTAYTFSEFNKEAYEDEDKNIIFKIQYHTFEEEEIIKKLLFLGTAVKIISPECIKEKYLDVIKLSLKNYES